MIAEPDPLNKQKKIQYLDPTDSDRRNFQRIVSSTNTSFVWNHFKRHIYNQNQFLCDYCGLVITTTSSNTTQMINHLKRKHMIQPRTYGRVRQKREQYPADEDFIEAIRQKQLRKKNSFSQQEDHLRDQLFDSDDEGRNKINEQIDIYSQNSRKQSLISLQGQFPVNQSNKHAGNIYYEENDENGEKQRRTFLKPRKVYTYPVQSHRIKKLRGPRGPYKQRNQAETNRQYWQNIFKNSHATFQGMEKNLKKKEERATDIVKKKEPSQQNELVIIQKATKQVRVQINNFMHSLPYNLLPSEVCQKFLSRYSCSPSLFNQMIKKYHWSSLNDRKCTNKLKTYYPHQIFVKVKKYEWSKGKQKQSQNLQQEKNKQRVQQDDSQFQGMDKDYREQRFPKINLRGQQDKLPNQQNENCPKNSQQNIIFIASANMRSNFAKYGSVVRILKQKNLILSKPIDSVVIFFSGFDNAANPLIFGVLILANESFENYKQGFQYFFSTMACEVSKVIIVEKEIQNMNMIQKAVDEICKLTRSQIRVLQHYNVKDLQEVFLLEEQMPQLAERSLIAMILNQVNRKKRIRLVQHCKPFLNEKMINKLESIISSADQENPVWIGMNLQVKKIVSLKKLLITPFVWRENLAKFLMHFFWVEKRLMEDMKQSSSKWGYLSQHHNRIAFYERVYQKYQVSYEIFDDNQQLFRLRNQLSAPIFQKLISLYITAVRHIKIQETDSPLLFRASFPRYRSKENEKQTVQIINYSSLHIVKFNIEKNCWECNCLLQFWIGLPCPHIIRLLLLYEGSISYYINSKWKETQQNGKNVQDAQQEQKDFFAIMEAAVNVTRTNEGKKKRTECEFYRTFWSQ